MFWSILDIYKRFSTTSYKLDALASWKRVDLRPGRPGFDSPLGHKSFISFKEWNPCTADFALEITAISYQGKTGREGSQVLSILWRHYGNWRNHWSKLGSRFARTSSFFTFMHRRFRPRNNRYFVLRKNATWPFNIRVTLTRFSLRSNLVASLETNFNFHDFFHFSWHFDFFKFLS